VTHNEALESIDATPPSSPPPATPAAGGDAPAAAAPAPTPPPASPPGAARDDLLDSLGRRFRGASLKLEFELRTAVTRQIFHRDFVYVSRQLHALEASRRVQGIDRQLLRDALGAIGRRADAARTLLLLCAAEARALIAVHGHGEADVAFARATRLGATIVSPHARSFLELLGQADDALIQLEKAWLLGLLDPTTKAREAADCRRALMGFKEMVRHQRHVVGLHVREVNAARRQAQQAAAANEPRAAETPAAQSGSTAPEDDRPAQAPVDARPDGDGYSASSAGWARAGAGREAIARDPDDSMPATDAATPGLRGGPVPGLRDARAANDGGARGDNAALAATGTTSADAHRPPDAEPTGDGRAWSPPPAQRRAANGASTDHRPADRPPANRRDCAGPPDQHRPPAEAGADRGPLPVPQPDQRRYAGPGSCESAAPTGAIDACAADRAVGANGGRPARRPAWADEPPSDSAPGRAAEGGESAST
jgi:hypothetical protein